MRGSFIFGAQAKKRTAALWARSAMKGDDCGVLYNGVLCFYICISSAVTVYQSMLVII